MLKVILLTIYEKINYKNLKEKWKKKKKKKRRKRNCSKDF